MCHTHHSCKRNIHLVHKPLWLQIGAALMYDAIKVLYRALDLLTTMRNVDFKRKVSCDEGYNSLPWFNGKALVNALKTVNLKNIYFKHLYLKLESFWYPLKVVFTPWTTLKVTYEGLTGRIQLDKNGDRRNFTLDIVKVREKQLYKVW